MCAGAWQFVRVRVKFLVRSKLAKLGSCVNMLLGSISALPWIPTLINSDIKYEIIRRVPEITKNKHILSSF